MELTCMYCKNTFNSIRKNKFCSERCCDNHHSKKRKIKTYFIPYIKNEIWKDIKGFENIYQASNLGRIKSLDRVTKDGRRLNSQLIKVSIHKNNGYPRVMLYDMSKYTAFRVHRIIAQLFIPNPENKPCVNHINGIKQDNRAKNLEWVTYSENERHSYKFLGKTGFWKGKKGELHPRTPANKQQKRQSN